MKALGTIVLIAALALPGCGGGGGSLDPLPKASPTPKPIPSFSPQPAGVPSQSAYIPCGTSFVLVTPVPVYNDGAGFQNAYNPPQVGTANGGITPACGSPPSFYVLNNNWSVECKIRLAPNEEAIINGFDCDGNPFV